MQGSVHGTGWDAWGQSLTSAGDESVEKVARGASRCLHTRSWSPALNRLCEEGPDNPSGLPCRAGAVAEPLQVHRAFGKYVIRPFFLLLVSSCMCHPVCPPAADHCGHLSGTRGNGEAQPVPSEPPSVVMLG